MCLRISGALMIIMRSLIAGLNKKENAEKLGLTGFARNLSDGRVEAVIEGEEDKIKELLEMDPGTRVSGMYW